MLLFLLIKKHNCETEDKNIIEGYFNEINKEEKTVHLVVNKLFSCKQN